MFGNVFKGKSVLVTGHTGFKGSWLCLWLNRLGARVTGLSLEPPTMPSHFVESEVSQLLQSHIVADVRDTETLIKSMWNSKPDLILQRTS